MYRTKVNDWSMMDVKSDRDALSDLLFSMLPPSFHTNGHPLSHTHIHTPTGRGWIFQFIIPLQPNTIKRKVLQEKDQEMHHYDLIVKFRVKSNEGNTSVGIECIIKEVEKSVGW